MDHALRYICTVYSRSSMLVSTLDQFLSHLMHFVSVQNMGTMGGDPHFSIILPDNNMLCYTVQGKRGSIFNLISNKNFQMNALFVPNSGGRNATWIGSLGIVMENNNYYSRLKLEASSKQIHMGDGIVIPAESISELHFNSGELCISIANTRQRTGKLGVRVSLEDVGLFFTIKFTQKHLEMFWHSTGKCDHSHGLIGEWNFNTLYRLISRTSDQL